MEFGGAEVGRGSLGAGFSWTTLIRVRLDRTGVGELAWFVDRLGWGRSD